MVFVLARVAAAFIALEGNCQAGFTPDCWMRADSGLYLRIAQHGHTLFPWEGHAGMWQGTAGWAPLYPLFIAVLTALLKTDPAMTALWLSWIFQMAYLLVVARLWEVNNFQLRHWLGISIAAFAPGSIYLHALFPVSLACFLLALVMLQLRREKYLSAGVFSCLAVLSYGIGFFLLAVLGMEAFRRWMAEKKLPWYFLLKTLIPALAGLFLWFGYDQWVTGHWNALFLIQSKYGHGIQSPLKMLGIRWQHLISEPFSLSSWIEIQNLTMTAYVLISLFISWKERNRPFVLFEGMWMLFYWFLPLSASTDVALYRNSAMLGPAHAMHRKRAAAMLGLMLVVFIVLWYPLGKLFIYSLLN
ncbi:MAG: hypothetical protein JNL57_02060 [Bacteroidetes bacterium]|nr:hypothetical protein [Bacteroidota bacterium]